MKVTGLIKWFLCAVWTTAYAAPQELVVATTFSPDTANNIIQRWQMEFPERKVRLINRTSASLERLLNQRNMERIDLILSSSPFLFQALQDKRQLAELPAELQNTSDLIPPALRSTTTTPAFSGYGILYNKKLLQERHLPLPTDWHSLFQPGYYNGLLMTSPSRSGTNHIMLEMLLQQKGWQRGWATILNLGANLSVISSRSFNVADRIKMGGAVAGISIDSYGGNADSELGFVYFPTSVASPTFIAVHKDSLQPRAAAELIAFLQSPKGQKIVAAPNIAKFPIQGLAPGNILYPQQQKLLAQPPLDHELLLSRQQVVERLFDTAVTFRLTQLKEVWGLIYQKEQKTSQKLTALRQLLLEVPITEEQLRDPLYLKRFSQDKNFASEQEQQWSEFFRRRLSLVLSGLGE
ncbi:phosphoglycerate transport regulatory protein PgtC [Mesocricetibacter intestinalis]|uniref:Phosphoglycerate transport regulatory protein PgtC n=1 Tax=Mesocricetibacter intestinalis TaxID=1521930 RepID=A0A4R6V7X0_9PAST|nr:ABC transporter substrate-binding protein [Mesocricetibacter intestinalis]TDQ57403.1 phosphoglycerate transport regulatory protein PgtC [Mesocricetibacter intestinalis]